MSRLRSAASSRSNATGRSVTSSVIKRNPATQTQPRKEYEFVCAPCEREADHAEATNYCTDCGENLSCVQQHRKFPAMRGHTILGKDGRRPVDISIPRTSLLDCPSHPGKAADMYCGEHDVVRCGACVAMEHRLTVQNLIQTWLFVS